VFVFGATNSHSTLLHSFHLTTQYIIMKCAAALALLAGSAAAFVPSQQQSARVSTVVNGGMDDLKTIAAKANPLLKYFDPLNFASVGIYNSGTDASIAFLRHSEIKHGRIAMFAFVGYCVHANGIHFPWPMTLDGTPFPSGSPPEIWDALPDAAKWQIILFIGFLEMWSEMAGTHYMKGGQPGKFPNFSDFPELIPHPVPFNLYDPFGLSKSKSAESKERGLVSELNNGRLAMIAILAFLAEQKVPGSVPLLSQIGDFPLYSGEVMAPFE